MRTGAFPPRTKEQHALHIQAVQENDSLTHVYGVKRQCALTAKLKYVDVLSGYLPDVLHDLFASECSFRINTFEELNKCIK